MRIARLSSKGLVQVLLTAWVLGIIAGFPWFSGVAHGVVPGDGTPVVFPAPPAMSTPAPNPLEPQTTQIIVDDQDSGFDLYGPSNGWHHSGSSDTTYNGHAYWTYTTDTWGNQNNWATWTVSLPESGMWEVFAYIPYVVTGRYDTTRARYQIQSTDGYDVVERDQNNNSGWVSLGAYNFNAGTNYFVRLEDVTPDWYFYSNGQQYRKTIKFDAIKWVRGGGTSPASVSIWVDRGEGAVYRVGDPLQLCYSVSRPIYIKIYDCQPGQACRVILEGHDDGQGDCRNYTVTPPTGWETVRIEAIENSQIVARDETYFYVTQDVDTEPPPGFCRVRWMAATSNNCSGEFGPDSPQRMTLFSDYKYRPSPDVKQFGPFNPDTSLVFYIRPWSSCGPAEYLSTSANAHISELGTNRWRIEWEDLPPDRADDYDDLIVEVECGIQPSCQDAAELVSQSPFPTVQPGQSFQIYFEVRNTGSCTWRQGDYYLANINGTPLGANPRQELGTDVPQGATKRWTINMTAPTTPGTYRTQWMLKHGENTFGPNMYIDVTVASPTYSISGRVTDSNNNPMSGVTISDGAGHTATTNSNGDYTFSGLPAGTYTLTPSMSDYTFSPASRTVSVPPSATGQDFTGISAASMCRPEATYSANDQIGSLAGYVKSGSGSTLSGVTVRVSGPVIRTTQTDSQGIYAFDGLPTGEYELTTAFSGYSTYTHSVHVYPACIIDNITMCTTDRWHGEYFANRNLQGPSSFVRCDAEIDFYWGNGSPQPGAPNDNFSVRWTRDIDFNQGWYRFRTFTDDGLRLYVDGVEVVNDWSARSFAERSDKIEVIQQGTYQVKMEYVEWVRDAMAHLSFYQCPNGQGDCSVSSGITPMYQTQYLEDPMPRTCSNEPNQTIARWGCLITSVAMALENFGINTTPRELNEWLSMPDSARGGKPRGYVDTCDGSLLWASIEKFAEERRVNLKWQATNDAARVIRNERIPVIMQGPGHYFLAVDVARVGTREVLGINDPHHAWTCQVVSASPPLPPRSELRCNAGSLRHATTVLEEDRYRGASTPIKYLRRQSQPRTASLQFSIRGTEILLTDAQGRQTGYDPTVGQVVNEIPNAFYYDSKIVPPGEEPDGILERTLFIPENAGGNYNLQVIGVSALASNTASGSTSNFEVNVVGFDAQFKSVGTTISGVIQPGTTPKYQIEFDPGREIRATPEGGKIYLPLILRSRPR